MVNLTRNLICDLSSRKTLIITSLPSQQNTTLCAYRVQHKREQQR